jgi:plasmid stabilization system protein ParE
MAKKIEWTQSAIVDRIQIYDYWAARNQSTSYSERLEFLFSNAANLLAEFPELGTLTSASSVRVKVLKTFKIFYISEAERIVIVRILDSRQNPKKLSSVISSQS